MNQQTHLGSLHKGLLIGLYGTEDELEQDFFRALLEPVPPFRALKEFPPTGVLVQFPANEVNILRADLAWLENRLAEELEEPQEGPYAALSMQYISELQSKIRTIRAKLSG